VFDKSSAPHFLDNWLTDNDEVVRLGRVPFINPRRFLLLIFVRGSFQPRSIMLLKVLGLLQNSVTSESIELAAFRLVAQ
jgi:hypothetical protein